MAITATDKTWYNTLVDDDGSGTLGTLWSKASVNSVLVEVDRLLCNTSGLTIAGPFFANSTITANGAMTANGASIRGTLFVNAAATINSTLLVNDLVTFNTTVTVLNSGVFANGYVSANLGFKEHGRTTPAGEWVNAKASFANTDFTGGGSMTWDVSSTDLVTFKYMLIGTTYFIDVYVDTSTIAGTPATQLFVKIPGGFLPAVKKQSGAAGFDNGVGVVTYTRVDVANNKIEIGKSDLTNWTASSNNTYVRVSMFFEVQ